MKNSYMRPDCDHCYHLHRGPILMVVPDGHVVVSCCKCKSMRTMHADHFYGGHAHEPYGRERDREKDRREDRDDCGRDLPRWPRWPRGPKYTLSVAPNAHPVGSANRRWNSVGNTRLGL